MVLDRLRSNRSHHLAMVDAAMHYQPIHVCKHSLYGCGRETMAGKHFHVEEIKDRGANGKGRCVDCIVNNCFEFRVMGCGGPFGAFTKAKR